MVSLNQAERNLIAQALTHTDEYSLRFRKAVDTLIETVFNNPSAELSHLEISYARDNQKIAAIKAYRERTGSSLIDAKRIVEGYMIRMGWMKNPAVTF